MRTTVTLDPDVERYLRTAMRRTGKSFKEVLNMAIRQALGSRERPAKRFRIQARDMGLRVGVDPVGLKRQLDDLEVEEFLARERGGG